MTTINDIYGSDILLDEDGQNVKIPAGRLVRTKPDGLGEIHRFVTTGEVVLRPPPAWPGHGGYLHQGLGRAADRRPDQPGLGAHRRE